MKKTFMFGLILIVSMFTMWTTEVKASTELSNAISIADMDYTTDYNSYDDMSSNCEDFAPTLRLGGYAIVLVKIGLPLILIAKASISMLSIVTKGDPGELKKQFSKLGVSLIASVIIFFIPTIVNIIFGFVSKYNSNITADSKICSACLFEPFGDTCTNYAEN